MGKNNELYYYDPLKEGNKFNEQRIMEYWENPLAMLSSQLINAGALAPKIIAASYGTNIEALGYIYGRGLLFSNEIYRLLTGGFPDGALARARALLELIVLARFISDSAAKHFDDLIGQKYIEHEIVLTKRYLNEAINIMGSNYKSLSDDEKIKYENLIKNKREIDRKLKALKDDYGKQFEMDYGWAYEAFKKRQDLKVKN